MRGRALVAIVATAAMWAATTGTALAGSGQHGPIDITSNAGFTSCACVTAGAGTASSPYVIGPWAITAPNGPGSASGSAITIDNTGGQITAKFTITGISINYDDSTPSDPVVHLIDVTGPATISNLTANADGTGIELDGASGITIDNVSVNKMVGPGLVIRHSSNISVANGKWKATADGELPHNEDGLYALDSTGLQIGTAADCPQSGACNTFDYDSGWGVYLQGTSNVTIDNASANADDTGGYVLDGSSGVTLENSTSEAGGPICISLNGAKVPTGYDSDLIGGLLLVNGAAHNTITGDTFNGTSTLTGFSIGSGGNGFYYNVCTGTRSPFPNPEAPMGQGNVFSSVCYTTTDVTGLPGSTCKS